MQTFEVTEATADLIAGLAAQLDVPPGLALAVAVERYHTAYVDKAGRLPKGWKLKEALTLADLETYYRHYSEEDAANMWAERGRVLRAALAAGWILAPAALTEDDIGKLTPAAAAAAKTYIDALYIRLVTADPNS